MQSFIQNKSLNLLFMLILLGLAIYLTWATSKQYKSIFRNQSQPNTQNNLISAKSTEKDTIKYEETSNNKSLVKMKFENVYNKFIWGSAGGGSGGGSTINYTTSIRSILRQIIDEYSIESMLDAPCGSFHWMPLFLKDIAEDFKRRGKRFRYHGVDVVERLISSARANYSNESDWSFSVCDFSAEALPDDFDLILSRDSLMHLSYQKIVDSLRMFSRVKGAKYLLTTSYLGRYGYNRNIEVGEFFEINLLAPPFKLKRFKRIFHEYNDQKSDHKSIVLYDIPNYLSKVNFDRLKRISANIKPPKSYSRIF